VAIEPVAATVALPGPARTLLELDVTVGAGARLMLEDAPLIVAEGADVVRTTTIRLGAGATAVVRDLVVLGRAGEGRGRLTSLLRVDGPDGPILHDALRIDPGEDDDHVALPPGARAVGTVAVLGDERRLSGVEREKLDARERGAGERAGPARAAGGHGEAADDGARDGRGAGESTGGDAARDGRGDETRDGREGGESTGGDGARDGRGGGESTGGDAARDGGRGGMARVAGGALAGGGVLWRAAGVSAADVVAALARVG
jgi:urease accessory protein